MLPPQSRSVASLAGSAATWQDCLGLDRGWLFNSSESIAANASVSGITIVNGHASGGAGMLLVSSAAAVRDVVFLYGLSDSSAGAVGSAQRSAGGGVSLYNSSATFDNVTFRCEVVALLDLDSPFDRLGLRCTPAAISLEPQAAAPSTRK